MINNNGQQELHGTIIWNINSEEQLKYIMKDVKSMTMMCQQERTLVSARTQSNQLSQEHHHPIWTAHAKRDQGMAYAMFILRQQVDSAFNQLSDEGRSSCCWPRRSPCPPPS